MASDSPFSAASCSAGRSAPGVPLRLPAVHWLAWANVVALVAWCQLRHWHYGSSALDLGAYHSVFWSLAHRGLAWNSVERMHQWSAHFELGLVPLALLYRIWATPTWLFLTQVGSVTAAAVCVEQVVRERLLDARLSAWAFAAMLGTAQLWFAEFYDFHSMTVCAFPMAVLALGIERDRLAPVILGAAGLLLLREQMGLAVAAAGAAWVLRHGAPRRLAGGVLAAIGLLVFFAEVRWVIPSYGDGVTFRYVAANYTRLGGSLGSVLQLLRTHPLRFVWLGVSGGRAVYPLAVAGCGLPLILIAFTRARRCCWPLLIAAPLLGVQMFADRWLIWSVRTHYGAPLVPLFILTAAFGLGVMRERWPHAAQPLAIAWALGSIGIAVFLTWPYAVDSGGPLDPRFTGSPRAAALAQAIALVPPEASVCAQDDLVPHLASRLTIHEWPDCDTDDQLWLLDAEGFVGNVPRGQVLTGIEQLRRDTRFALKLDSAGVLVAQRLPRAERGAP